jgi:hypothetical protein
LIGFKDSGGLMASNLPRSADAVVSLFCSSMWKTAWMNSFSRVET